MKALIDSDILVYRVGFTTEEETEEIAKYRMATAIELILDGVIANDYTCYLTSQDKSNFRYEIDPQYKAHRIQPKPKHYLYLRNLLISDYAAQVCEGQEADDQLAQDQTEDTAICTIDKDLDQVSGWHYNFVTLRKYFVSPLEAIRSFYEQVLIGDHSDGVTGCPKIGKVKANRILEGCQNNEEMLEAVIHQYERAYGDEYTKPLDLALELLWIRKHKGVSFKDSSEGAGWKKHLQGYSKPIELDLSTSQESTSILFQSRGEHTPQTSS